MSEDKSKHFNFSEMEDKERFYHLLQLGERAYSERKEKEKLEKERKRLEKEKMRNEHGRDK